MPSPSVAYDFSPHRGRHKKSLDAMFEYRGFSTSFSHSFVDPNEGKGDTCALACCGLLQMERNKFLVDGQAPSSFAGRFTVLLVVPSIIFSAAWYVLLHKPEYQQNGGVIGTIFLWLLVTLFFLHVFKTLQERVKLRRQVLRRKYAQQQNNLGRVDELKDKSDQSEGAYLMGQTVADLYYAHAPCGCYRGDIDYEEQETPAPKDMCDFLWQFFMCCCCEKIGDTYVQCCGVCAIAQETRDISMMFPPHRRAMDYVTMQPVLEYYSHILELRNNKNSNVFMHATTLSDLSLQILWTFTLGFVTIVVFCLVFGVWMKHLGMVAALFVVANTFLWVPHWRYTKMILSADAVIKGFASGFYIASTMAFPFVAIIYLISEGAMYLSVTLLNDDDGYFAYYTEFANSDDSIFFTPWKTVSGAVFSKMYPISYLSYLFFQCFAIAFVEELVKYLTYRMVSDHPDFWTRTDLEKVLHETRRDNQEAIVDLESLPRIHVHSHVRSLQSRCLGVVVTIISVSLGFACCENLIYACAYYMVDITWRHLLVRAVLLPIHPVCAAWQASRVCESSFELKVNNKVGMALLPAVVFHGLFDYAVVAGDFLAENESDYFKWLVPFVVFTIALSCVVVTLGNLKNRLDGKDVERFDVRNTWSWMGSKAESDDGSNDGSNDRFIAPSKFAGIAQTKSLDDILLEHRAFQSATIYHAGTWEIQTCLSTPDTQHVYAPPKIKSLSTLLGELQSQAAERNQNLTDTEPTEDPAASFSHAGTSSAKTEAPAASVSHTLAILDTDASASTRNLSGNFGGRGAQSDSEVAN